jgi:hypothetical protein
MEDKFAFEDKHYCHARSVQMLRSSMCACMCVSQNVSVRVWCDCVCLVFALVAVLLGLLGVSSCDGNGWNDNMLSFYNHCHRNPRENISGKHPSRLLGL